MPTLDKSNFNIFVALAGGWLSLFGLVSFLVKENFYLSEALISLLAGILFSPHAANWIRPLEYGGTEKNVEAITLAFTRLVLGVQLVLAGIQLPSRYLKTEWKPLAWLLGPVMTLMWITTSLLVWAMVPNLHILHALAIGACVTPTDPVLSNVIVKGRFADHNIPEPLQRIIIAESGANDGLGYPFLFLALYLIKYLGDGGQQFEGGAGLAIGLWFGETWGYVIILSVIYGAVVGWLAKRALYFCEKRKYVDRESFLVFALSLALFIVGTCGMIGTDDILACFVAGNVFTWDDWFRLQTLDDSLQPTIDMLLNVAVFMWYGAVIPWHSFLDNDVIPIGRLVALGVLILLLRRIPWVLGSYPFRNIPQLDDIRQATFMGFFGPIGCSAVFYIYITIEFIEGLNPGGGEELRPDVAKMPEDVRVICWFLIVCSVVVHGLSIPLGKLGIHLPRTMSRNLSTSTDRNHLPSFNVGRRAFPWTSSRSRSGEDSMGPTDDESGAGSANPRPLFRIGGSIIPQRPSQHQNYGTTSAVDDSNNNAPATQGTPTPSRGVGSNKPQGGSGTEESGQQGPSSNSETRPSRAIRFPDEEGAKTPVLSS